MYTIRVCYNNTDTNYKSLQKTLISIVILMETFLLILLRVTNVINAINNLPVFIHFLKVEYHS